MPDGIRKTFCGSAWGEKVDAPLDFRVARAGFAVHISGFQIYMSTILMSMIYGGVLERHPRMRMVHRRGRYRLDPVHPRPHEPRVGGPVRATSASA